MNAKQTEALPYMAWPTDETVSRELTISEWGELIGKHAKFVVKDEIILVETITSIKPWCGNDCVRTLESICGYYPKDIKFIETVELEGKRYQYPERKKSSDAHMWIMGTISIFLLFAICLKLDGCI